MLAVTTAGAGRTSPISASAPAYHLRDSIFGYSDRRQIRFYRLAGQLAPYLTHPGLPGHRQLDECATDLAATGDPCATTGCVRRCIRPTTSTNAEESGRAACGTGRARHAVGRHGLIVMP